ncbi:dienelactone hydrolase family protein [bacterium]|nr:dienelactone hydrolase family protein [Mariniblastus sp.]MDA7911955.1 dienelactone hydrolase family protein [bacterium]
MIQKTETKIGDLDCVLVKSEACQTPTSAVIFCHGFGAPGTDLVSLADVMIEMGTAQQNAVYVFPAAPIELDPLFDSRAWWMIDIEKIQNLMMNGETREMQDESPDLLPQRRTDLTYVIDHCRHEYSLPASKIVIGGFSQGSMLATDVALHYPEALGGLIVWSGALINSDQWTLQAERQSPLKITQSHGTIDPILPIDGARDLKDMLESHHHQIEYIEFHGPHSIPMNAVKLAGQLIGNVVND